MRSHEVRLSGFQPTWWGWRSLRARSLPGALARPAGCPGPGRGLGCQHQAARVPHVRAVRVLEPRGPRLTVRGRARSPARALSPGGAGSAAGRTAGCLVTVYRLRNRLYDQTAPEAWDLSRIRPESLPRKT